MSPGICCGPASIIQWELPTVTRRLVSADQVDGEFRRLQEAVVAVTALLGELRDRTIERAGVEEAKIFARSTVWDDYSLPI